MRMMPGWAWLAIAAVAIIVGVAQGSIVAITGTFLLAGCLSVVAYRRFRSYDRGVARPPVAESQDDGVLLPPTRAQRSGLMLRLRRTKTD
jgi:hypothetical protein